MKLCTASTQRNLSDNDVDRTGEDWKLKKDILKEEHIDHTYIFMKVEQSTTEPSFNATFHTDGIKKKLLAYPHMANRFGIFPGSIFLDAGIESVMGPDKIEQ